MNQTLIQRGYAIIIKARRDGTEYGHLVRGQIKALAISLHLFAHITQRILTALTLKLVDRHDIGKVQHIDLFKLRGCTKFRRHHIQ